MKRKTFADDLKTPEVRKEIVRMIVQRDVDIDSAVMFAHQIGVAEGAAKEARRRASNAGKASAEMRKANWHDEAVNIAQGLIDAGKAPHEITSLVAKRIGKSSRLVRPVLQGAGLVKKKKEAR